MRTKLMMAIVVAVSAISACVTIPDNKVISENYLDYQPISPIPASKVKVYDKASNSETEVFWESLTGVTDKRSLLPIQSAQIYVNSYEVSGKASYLVSSISAKKGSYKVTMDYMKYRVEDVYDESGIHIGSGRVGVGLRIKALVVTNKAKLNLGSLSVIGLEASRGNLSGGISVDIVGIDSASVTDLIPLTSEINQTSIQSALQALASIKAKLWGKNVKITPHLLAFYQKEPNKEEEIRNQISSVSTYLKSISGDLLRRYWKPDGENVHPGNEKRLKKWMASNRLAVSPGSIAMFLHTSAFEGLRKKAVLDLKFNNK